MGTCNPALWRVETGESGVLGQPRLHETSEKNPSTPKNFNRPDGSCCSPRVGAWGMGGWYSDLGDYFMAL